MLDHLVDSSGFNDIWECRGRRERGINIDLLRHNAPYESVRDMPDPRNAGNDSALRIKGPLTRVFMAR